MFSLLFSALSCFSFLPHTAFLLHSIYYFVIHFGLVSSIVFWGFGDASLRNKGKQETIQEHTHTYIVRMYCGLSCLVLRISRHFSLQSVGVWSKNYTTKEEQNKFQKNCRLLVTMRVWVGVCLLLTTIKEDFRDIAQQ